MKRRTFIAGVGGAAAWPVVAWGQQPAMPLIGFLDDRFHESCHFGGIHSGWLDSHIGPVSPNGAGWKSWQRGGGRLNCRSEMRIRRS